MNFSYLKSVAIVAITSTILLSGTVVEAKKMGGGMSIGRQSNTITKNQNALPPKPVAPPVNAAPKPAAPNPATPQAPAPSRFGGMGGILGGIAAGIGLSYLFSHLGMGAEMGSMFSSLLIVIAIALIGMWLFRKLMSRNASSPSLSTGIPGMNFQQIPEIILKQMLHLVHLLYKRCQHLIRCRSFQSRPKPIYHLVFKRI
jgi:hypothetical protein